MEHQLKNNHKLPHKLAGTVGHLWSMVDVKVVATSHTAWLQHGASCSQGDVVLLSNDGSGRRAGQIQLHVAFAGQSFCLVALLSLLEIGKEYICCVAQQSQPSCSNSFVPGFVQLCVCA